MKYLWGGSKKGEILGGQEGLTAERRSLRGKKVMTYSTNEEGKSPRPRQGQHDRRNRLEDCRKPPQRPKHLKKLKNTAAIPQRRSQGTGEDP